MRNTSPPSGGVARREDRSARIKTYAVHLLKHLPENQAEALQVLDEAAWLLQAYMGGRPVAAQRMCALAGACGEFRSAAGETEPQDAASFLRLARANGKVVSIKS